MTTPIPSPFNKAAPGIALTKEQAQAYLQERSKKFAEKFKQITEETGMTIVAYLETTPGGIIPKLAVVPVGNPPAEPAKPTSDVQPSQEEKKT